MKKGFAREGALACLVALAACQSNGAAPAPNGVAGCRAPEGSLVVAAYHGDRARLGWNAAESALTPAAVAGGAFGPLWTSAPFDTLDAAGTTFPGRMYGSPLYVDGLDVHGGAFDGQRLDVVIVATSNGWVYAIDAFDTPCATGHVRAGDVVWRAQVGLASVVPELDGSKTLPGIALGVTSTPVIDRDGGRVYVVAMDASAGPPTWRAYALDLASGALAAGWPVTIDDAAVAPLHQNGPTTFDPDARRISQRAALTLSPGAETLYVGFGGYADHAAGWLVSIDTRAPRIVSAFAGAPNAPLNVASAGIWSPGGPVVDASGNLFATMGNGIPEWAMRNVPGAWGNTLLAWRGPSLDLFATYSPWNYCQDEIGDTDLGGDSPVLLPDQDPATTSTPHLLAFGAKQGVVYLVDRDHLPGSTVARPGCSQSPGWQDAAHDGSLLPPPGMPYCDANGESCVSGPLSVFGPYSDLPEANNLNHAKSRTTPAYFRDASGAQFLFVSGSTKDAPVSDTNVPPSVVRLRLNVAAGAPAYLSVDAGDGELAFVNPGSPVVSSNGGGGAVVWVLDQNAKRTDALLDPTIPHPILYAIDGATMRVLWRSSQEQLEIGGKYSTALVAHGVVFVGTDRLHAFGLRM